jgi:hypothetical protein
LQSPPVLYLFLAKNRRCKYLIFGIPVTWDCISFQA